MTAPQNPKSPVAGFQALNSIQGNVLVYLVVVVLIFGVLGVTIVSLFTSTTSSTATPNNAKRAAYVTESAMRYAFGELRGSGFDTAVISALNTTTYSFDSTGSFTFNIFGPWFKANESKAIPDGVTDTIDVIVPAGKLPAAWAARNPGTLWMVNYDYLDLSLSTARNGIYSWTQLDDTTLRITTTSDFVVKEGERVCLAIKLSESQTIGENGNLYLDDIAKDFLPEYNGAININRIDYVYQRLIHEPASSRVKLENVSTAGMPNTESGSAFPLDLNINNDFIVLSPRNYLVIPTGTADSVSIAGTLDRAVNIYDAATVKPMTRLPDIVLDRYDLAVDLNATGTTGFVTVDNNLQTVDVGSGLDSGQVDFGGIWFSTDETIGGKIAACDNGACDFGRGVRVFFTLDYSGTGDGLTFALISAVNNTTSSIGGDIEMGELLGYGGDSRKVVNPTSASDFLDAAGAGRNPPNPGLHPPKIALEFDVYNNNTDQVYCNAGAIVDNNRNDPLSGGKDALQYVFWGSTSLAVPCRDYTIGSTTVADHPSYDDNRHDSGDQEQKWKYDTDIWNSIRSTPALSNDGSTVYVGSDDHYFYAVYTADGTTSWWFGTGGDVRSSPVVGPDGMVYVGSHGGAGHGRVYAFNPAARLLQPGGSTLNTSAAYKEWVFYTPNNVNSSPAIGADGKIYIGDDHGNFYALNPADRWAASQAANEPKEDTLTANEWKFTNAGFNTTSRGYPAIGPAFDADPVRERLYITSSDADENTLWALNPADGSIDWSLDNGDENEFMPAVDPVTGVIYTDGPGGQIKAITHTGSSAWATDPVIGIDNFTKLVGPNGIVYAAGTAGASIGKLTALDKTNGDIIWEFTDSGNLADIWTTPAVAPDGTIYFGASDGLLYAVNPDGSKRWTFPIPVDDKDNEGHSSPTVGDDGVVYIGSSWDTALYAINNFTIPRNIRDRYLTLITEGTSDTVGGSDVTVDDTISWLNGALAAGPWAVRLEVMRSLSQNAGAKYEYELRAWLRQCTSGTCANLLGTFYEDTRIQYSVAPHLAQTIELPQSEHDDFATFIFGFTGAAGQASSQTAAIADVKLSFIRFNDPIAP